MKAIMDAHAEGASFKPDRGCSAFEGIVFATDEDFKQVNDPFISDKFWAALEPASAIEKERPGFSRYCCVLRTDVTVKGYFLASNKLEFGRNNTHKLAIYIRQILEVGEPKLIDVSSREYLSR